ncbi:protein DBF4 homolog B isoform X2 [Choloepus didactylus]|nr:protein DBF4 homolog B isoform X2 [Choloepus didactylus]XP_037665919.1 protein DBF4 homolog B isoform X2 [Choloepus didactylus]XP_037665920.1 protein DBF4 homolog B isoform X2 [Choloepus didactylus]XP_037665921.1 protein DBF4 homolog B isoform X2 [Choloepus didactylus]
MAETRLRASDLGAQLRVSSWLRKCRKSLSGSGRQPFSGKSFYLDLPAGKNLQLLTGAIQQLGGVIEGFLSKEVSYIVSSRREAKAEITGTSHRGCPSPSEVRVDTPCLANPKGSCSRPSQKPVDLVPMSRGKELLQKAIKNQGSSSGGGSGGSSSLLSNARSWGVRILHVDEMMMHVQQLSLGALIVKKQESKKPEGTRPATESRTRKVARLKAPFLKIEDESRKFRPFHHQFKSFPEISFLGPKDASPFETPTTLDSSQHTRGPKDQEPSLQSAARTVPRRKKGYCECCQEAFEQLHVHLQSAQHQGFALEALPYAEVDRIIAQLGHSLADTPSQASLPRRPGFPASDCDPLGPETLPPSQPSHPRAACPRMRREDDCQAPGAPEQDGTLGSTKEPTEPAGTNEVPGPAASCRELSVDFLGEPPGTPVSRNLACQCLLTTSGSADPSSGSDLALVGHKRKVQSPSGNAEKKRGGSWPQAPLFDPKAPNPYGTRTAGGRHLLSLPLPSHEHRPLAALLPLCHPPTRLSLPDHFPWQPLDRSAEFWATQPHWPGGGWSQGFEDPEWAAPGPVSPQADHSPSCPEVPSLLPTPLHSAACVQPPEGTAETQSTSPHHPLPASGGASCSQWFWAPQPLQVPCLPVSHLGQPQS